MAEAGEDKLIAVARHITRTLGRTDTMTDDILRIFSTYDDRFSRDKLSDGFASAGDGNDDGIHLNSSYSLTDRSLKLIDRKICHFLTMDHPVWSVSADAPAFLESIDELLSVMPDLDSPQLVKAEVLLQRSMLWLEEEFRALMHQSDSVITEVARNDAIGFDFDDDGEDYTDDEDHIPVAQPVQDYNIVVDALPPGTVADLHEIARRMVEAGFGKECAHAYASSRRDFLEESVARLGLRQRSSNEAQQVLWSDIEEEIPRWTRAVEVAFRILFPSERRLCDRIFAGLHAVSDLAFAEACRGTVIPLLGFADAVAVGNHSPERLFRVVDMYEVLSGVLPDLATLFADQYSSVLRIETDSVWRGLGAAIRGIFMELENLIRRDPAKVPVPGGGLHPISRYVMNYIRTACASRRSLQLAMDDATGGSASASMRDLDVDLPSSSLSVQIAWIMEVLHSNLEAKSKLYKEPGLRYIFLMNNTRYIIQKARGGELGMLLGNEWARRESARVRRWHGEYQRAAWGKLLAVLRTGSGVDASGGSRALLERVRMFENYLEEVCKEHRGWVICDEQLREELRVSVEGLVVPLYRVFLARLMASMGGASKHNQRSGAKFSVEDVETKIAGLFEGGARRP